MTEVSTLLQRIFSTETPYDGNIFQHVEENDVIECQRLASRYTVGVIGSCIFGIVMRSMTKEEVLFRKMGRMVFEPSVAVFLKRFIFLPFNYFQLQRLDTCVSDLFANILKDAIVKGKQSRGEKNGNRMRNDFIDLLLQAEEADKDFRKFSLVMSSYSVLMLLQYYYSRLDVQTNGSTCICLSCGRSRDVVEYYKFPSVRARTGTACSREITNGNYR